MVGGTGSAYPFSERGWRGDIMFFKLDPIKKDKYTDMGMVNISASFFIEEGDEGWDKYQAEHHVVVPILPESGYPGKRDESGVILDREDYIAWIKSLPTEEKDNPFCNHSIQFEADVTDEEILWCFEFALAQTHLNYLADDLHCKKGKGKVVNQDINYIKRRQDYILNKETLTPFGLSKVANAETKVTSLKKVDFSTVETIANYKVKK